MRIRTVVAALAAAAAMGVMATAAQAATGNFVGNAYGSYANVDNLVVAAPTAEIGFGCLTPPNSKGADTVASVNVPKVLQLGAIDTGAVTSETATTIGDATMASIGDVNVLGGLIKANAIRAQSATQFTATGGFQVNAHGSELVNLVIGGKAIPVNVGPNTTIALPGIGKVTLNEQIPIADGTTVGLTVNMIHVDVTIAQKGIAAGTQIIIGHATSGLAITSGTDDEVIGGRSFATEVRIGGLVTSSPTFPALLNVGIGCGSVLNGTDTNTGVGVQIPGIISSGTLTQTATGHLDVAGGVATGDTTSSIEHLNILGGLVTATVIKAESNATATPTSSAFNAGGSELVGLTVKGKAIPVNVGPNTHISIAGLTVWINRVIRTSNSLEVRMLEVTGIGNKAPVNGSLIDIIVADAQTQT